MAIEFSALAQGFALGGGLIVAIGAQNALILRLGLTRTHVFIACLFCSLVDVAMQIIGANGVGTLVASSPVVLSIASLGGALFLGWYGFNAAQRALGPDQGLDAAGQAQTPLGKVLLELSAMTFLNPHMYLDTVVLTGAISGHYAWPLRTWFVVGAGVASCLWFFSLGYGARLLAPVFQRPIAWRVLDAIIAVIMATIALELLIGVVKGNSL